MRQLTRKARFQRIRAAIFVVAAVLILVLSGLYAAGSLKAADTPNDTTPPFTGFSGQATPNQGIQSGSEIDVVLTILPRARDYSYLTTLRVTSTVPTSFRVISGSLSASTPATLPVLVDSRTVTWTGEFASLATSDPITIGYRMQAPPCYQITPPGNGSLPDALPSSQSLTIVSALHELTNSVMITPAQPVYTLNAIDWTGTDCGTYLPYIRLQPTPTAIPAFPALVNGNFENGPIGANAGWAQEPAQLIYSTSAIPAPAQNGAQGGYVAWLGGGSNSVNRLSQKVTLPAVYNARLKLRYFTASEETACDSDTAVVYIAGSSGKLQKDYKLCQSQTTNGWRADTLDLAGINGEVTLLFESKLNGSRSSNWFLDDIALCNATDPACR